MCAIIFNFGFVCEYIHRRHINRVKLKLKIYTEFTKAIKCFSFAVEKTHNHRTFLCFFTFFLPVCISFLSLWWKNKLKSLGSKKKSCGMSCGILLLLWQSSQFTLMWSINQQILRMTRVKWVWMSKASEMFAKEIANGNLPLGKENWADEIGNPCKFYLRRYSMQHLTNLNKGNQMNLV